MTESEYAILEGFESEQESEFAERRRGVQRPSTKPSFQQRPTTVSYVTQVQLEAALSRVDGKIKTVSDSTAAINSRVNTIAAAAKKENEDRKKELEAQKKDFNGKVQLLALLPLLVRPASITTAAAVDNIPAGSKVLVESSDSLTALLPLLLIGGMGGGSGGLGLGGDGSSDSSLLILALVLGLGKR